MGQKWLEGIARAVAGLSVTSSAPEHRLRRAVVPVSAAVFVLLVLVGSSIVAMAQRETERVEQRVALLAPEPSPTDLNLALGDDRWDDALFPVYWIEPAGDEPPVLPPGVERLPEPGGAVVSPALDRLASRHPTLAERYPDRSVLEPEGVQSGDELFAYIRVPEGRSLTGNLASNLSEDARAVRVRAFGPPSGEDVPYWLSSFSLTPSATVMAKGVIGFLVVPGLAVLAAGLATASGARSRRPDAPQSGVAARRTLDWPSLRQTLILASSGLAGGTILWGTVSPHVERVPVVGHYVLRGDLALPWWLLSAVLFASFVATVFVAIAVAVATVFLQRKAPRWRIAFGPASIVPLYAVPLGVTLLAFALGWPVPLGAMVTLYGIMSAVIGVLIALPVAVRAVGADLSRLSSPSASLAGRELERDPVRTASPFLGGAALVIVALSASAYLAQYGHDEAFYSSSAEAQAVSVEWLDPRPEDLNRLAHAVGGGLVAPVGEGGPTPHEHAVGHEHAHASGHDHQDENALVVGVTCRRLAPYFSGAGCDSRSPFELPVRTERRLAETLAAATHDHGSEVRLAPAEDVAHSGRALALDEAPLRVLEGRVRDAAMQTLPAPSVYSMLNNVKRPIPAVAWMAAGTTVGLVATMIGYLLWLFGRLLGPKERRLLARADISPLQLAAFEAWMFAAPYTAVVAIAFCAGLVVCALTIAVFPFAPIPWRGIGLTLGTVVFAGLVGTAGAALFGTRSLRKNPE